MQALERAETGDAEEEEEEEEAQLAFDALLYRLVVIGEAVKALPADLLARQPQVRWQEIARLRDPSRIITTGWMPRSFAALWRCR